MSAPPTERVKPSPAGDEDLTRLRNADARRGRLVRGVMLAVALCFATFMAWRDSSTLQAANLMAVLVALALAMLYCRAGSLQSLTMPQATVGTGLAILNAAIGSVLLVFCDLPWRMLPP